GEGFVVQLNHAATVKLRPVTVILGAVIRSPVLICRARPILPSTSVVPVSVPWFPSPEKSFISPSGVKVSILYAKTSGDGGGPNCTVREGRSRTVSLEL